MSRASNAARHRARRRIVQALYQWQIGGDEVHDIIAQFVEGREWGGVDIDFFRDVMRALGGNSAKYDQYIEPLLQRSLAMVDPVERAVLRLVAYELLERLEVPARVVIDEAVELAREFGSDQGHRFVNGLADRLAHQVRTHEFGQAAPPT